MTSDGKPRSEEAIKTTGCKETMRLVKQHLRRIIREAIIREAGYEGRYFDQHGTGQYSPDEQFNEDLHFILDTSPSENSYWRQAYELIEALDDDEKYMGEVIAEKMWERHTNRNYDYRY